MLQNAYFLAKIGADTAENEQHLAEILPKTGNYPTGPPHGSWTRRREVGDELFGRAWTVSVLLVPGAPTRKSGEFRQDVARFRLYRHRFLQVNARFAAFFKI